MPMRRKGDLSEPNNAVAEPVIGPAVRGTYVITPETLRNPRRIAFVGPSDSSALIAQRSRESTPMVSAAGSVDCDALGEIETLYFSLGSKALSASSQSALDRAATMLSTCPHQRVEIQGYADTVGSVEQNLVLSRERAERVATRLHEKGVASDRLDAQGYGEFGAIDGDAEDRALNRRVVISVRGSGLLESGERHSQR